jgi:hypothetical protein
MMGALAAAVGGERSPGETRSCTRSARVAEDTLYLIAT